jgi:hypothetical protein
VRGAPVQGQGLPSTCFNPHHLVRSRTDSVPELEPVRESSPESREAPQTVPEEPYSTHAPPTPETPVSGHQERKRSWWREFLGME